MQLSHRSSSCGVKIPNSVSYDLLVLCIIIYGTTHIEKFTSVEVCVCEKDYMLNSIQKKNNIVYTMRHVSCDVTCLLQLCIHQNIILSQPPIIIDYYFRNAIRFHIKQTKNKFILLECRYLRKIACNHVIAWNTR